MAGLIGKIIEFLLGFFVVALIIDIIGGLLIMLILPFLMPPGAEASQIFIYSQIILYVLRGIVLIVLFFIRKIIAIGYLASIILDILFGFALPSLIGIQPGVS